jgi:hypothetical protein
LREEEEERVNIKRFLGAVAILAAAGVTTTVALVPATARPTMRRIVYAKLDHDLEVIVTATRGPSEGGAPTATVSFEAFRLAGGERVPLGSDDAVGRPNGWFWYVVTGPAAVCRFSVDDHPPIMLKLSLLISPSIGCSDVFRYGLGLPPP